MNRTVASLITAAVFFMVGLLSYAGAQWFLSSYLSKTIAVRGVLKFQAQTNNPGASGNPPAGYFIESTAIDRVYVEGDLIKPYVGSLVLLQGTTLSTVCGPDTYPCYPKLLVKAATQAPGQK